jgi:hypothetical protein
MWHARSRDSRDTLGSSSSPSRERTYILSDLLVTMKDSAVITGVERALRTNASVVLMVA